MVRHTTVRQITITTRLRGLVERLGLISARKHPAGVCPSPISTDTVTTPTQWFIWARKVAQAGNTFKLLHGVPLAGSRPSYFVSKKVGFLSPKRRKLKIKIICFITTNYKLSDPGAAQNTHLCQLPALPRPPGYQVQSSRIDSC